jgi:HAD superfamily hydrolase (TIGR01509 family)
MTVVPLTITAPMPYQAIIFDCDGTLVDSERLVNEVVVEFAALFGINLSVDEALARFRGAKMADCVSHLESLGGRALPSSFVTDLRARMARVISTRLKPVDGAIDLVRSLSTPFCVASGGPREKIELSLSVTGLLPYFEGRIFSSYEVGSWKPAPGLFIHAAQSLGARPAHCAVVEDSSPGIQAGIAAGMTVFALVDGSSPSQIPASAHAVTGLRELVALLS